MWVLELRLNSDTIIYYHLVGIEGKDRIYLDSCHLDWRMRTNNYTYNAHYLSFMNLADNLAHVMVF